MAEYKKKDGCKVHLWSRVHYHPPPPPPLVVVGTHLHIYTFFCANITTAAKTSEVIYLHLRVSTVRARGGGFCGMSDVIHQHTRGDKLHFHRE